VVVLGAAYCLLSVVSIAEGLIVLDALVHDGQWTTLRPAARWGLGAFAVLWTAQTCAPLLACYLLLRRRFRVVSMLAIVVVPAAPVAVSGGVLLPGIVGSPPTGFWFLLVYGSLLCWLVAIVTMRSAAFARWVPTGERVDRLVAAAARDRLTPQVDVTRVDSRRAPCGGHFACTRMPPRTKGWLR
jgi:hypothetical protein